MTNKKMETSTIILILVGILWITTSLILALKYEKARKATKDVKKTLEGVKGDVVDIVNNLAFLQKSLKSLEKDVECSIDDKISKIKINGAKADNENSFTITGNSIKNGSDIENHGTTVSDKEETITDTLNKTVKEIIENEQVVSTAINTIIKSCGLKSDGKAGLPGGKSLTAAITELYKLVEKKA